jgi:hypothetical protein
MAHRQCSQAQVNNLHRVRMTTLLLARVTVVATVRRDCRARCNVGHVSWTSYLIRHDRLPSSSGEALNIHTE